MGPIEQFSSLPLDELRRQYLAHAAAADDESHLSINVELSEATSSLESAHSMKRQDKLACFRLIESTSKPLYASSLGGWSPAAKKAEMDLTDLRYLLLHPSSDGPAMATKTNGSVIGFMSFMATYEDDRPCLYCYEIHLDPVLRGKGIGGRLMTWLEHVASSLGVALVMLTVFNGNPAAIRFYERRGYKVDSYSPKPRILRSGREVIPDYRIMSKNMLTHGQ